MTTFKTNSSQSDATLEWVDSHEFHMDYVMPDEQELSKIDRRAFLLRPLGGYLDVSGVMSIDPQQWWALSNKTKEITENEFIMIYQPDINLFVKRYGLYQALYVQNSDFYTYPLHTAAYAGNLHVIRFFINKGLDVNLLNSEKLSALHVAIRANKVACARVLIEAGANITITPEVLMEIIGIDNTPTRCRALFELFILLNVKIQFPDQYFTTRQLNSISAEYEAAKFAIKEKIMNNIVDEYIVQYVSNQLKAIAQTFSQKETLLLAQESMALSVGDEAILLTENQVELIIDYLEKQKDALSYLTCGLLLQGYIENALPERLMAESDSVAYLEKRTHDAISYYIQSVNQRKEYAPIINQLLWELKIDGSTSIQERLACFDIKPIAFSNYQKFTHEPVKLPRSAIFSFFSDVVQNNEKHSIGDTPPLLTN